MADDENQEITETKPKASEGGVLDLNSALQQLLKKSAAKEDGLARGLREAVKALDRKVGRLCILAQDCDSAEYVRLVEALAAEHKIDLIKVPDGKQLGEWVGLCKLDREGNPKKVVKCSCAVVREIGEATEAWTFIKDYISKQG
jgi:small subunit ribosomal protein S12e